jgi:hypothetical protein
MKMKLAYVKNREEVNEIADVKNAAAHIRAFMNPATVEV